MQILKKLPLLPEEPRHLQQGGGAILRQVPGVEQKVMWRGELKQAIRQILEKRDMTVAEIRAELKHVYKVSVPYQALNSKLTSMRGVYSHVLVPSLVGVKMVKQYTLSRVKAR